MKGEVGERIRGILDAVGSDLGRDLSQASWLRKSFDRLKAAAAEYRASRGRLEVELEDRYRRVRARLGIEGAVERIEGFLEKADRRSLEELLDGKIVWLNEYLPDALDAPLEKLAGRLRPATRQLRRITEGYGRLGTRAAEALR